MNAWIGWALAVAVIAAGWQSYGAKGVVLGITVTVFWLLLQFNRSVRVMKNAAERPIGHLGSAVMFNAKLKAGMTMLKVVASTKSLGVHVSERPDTWRWTDAGHSHVTLVFDNGKLKTWELWRPEPEPDAPVAAPTETPH